MRFPMIRTAEDLAALTERLGILPYFTNPVPGWSVEENIDPAVWFTDREGPWEWKGPLARDRRVVYGKLVQKKAAFVSLSAFADLANYRRDGYDFEGRVDDGLVPWQDERLMAFLEKHGPSKSRAVRKGCGVTKGFDTALVRLEMQTFIIDQDFVYELDRTGRPYGWGVALLARAEDHLGEEIVNGAEALSPAASLTRITHRLCCAMPDVDELLIRRVLR